MKKLDIIIIISVLLICGLLNAFYWNNNQIDQENLIIQIQIQDKVIYELKQDQKAYVIEINSQSNNTQIELSVFDNSYNKIDSKIIRMKLNNSLSYKINVQKDITYVMSAECLHKYCMKMKLTPNITTPIICTDGLIIKYKTSDMVTIIA